MTASEAWARAAIGDALKEMRAGLQGISQLRQSAALPASAALDDDLEALGQALDAATETYQQLTSEIQ